MSVFRAVPIKPVGLQFVGPGHRANAFKAAIVCLTIVTTGCGNIVYLFPQENRNNSIDLKLIDANSGMSTSLKVSDEDGYFATESGYYQFFWPSSELYGQAAEQAYIYFYPLIPGIQTLGGGYVTTADGSWSLAGHAVDFDIEWKGSRKFPFIHSGTFLEEEYGGVTVEGDFTLSNMNCLADTFDYDSEYECGRSFEAGGSYDVSWAIQSEYNWCPQALIDAFVGSDLTGSISEKKLKIGDIKLDCVDGYNNRYMCGQNTVEVEAEGCTWKVLGRGGPAGYDPAVVTGWFIVSASTDCESATTRLCETWFTGTPE